MSQNILENILEVQNCILKLKKHPTTKKPQTINQVKEQKSRKNSPAEISCKLYASPIVQLAIAADNMPSS